LSACMEISQSKPFVKLTYANKNRKEKSWKNKISNLKIEKYLSAELKIGLTCGFFKVE
jgi:hypothetical protein